LKAGHALIRGSKNEHRWRTIPIVPAFKSYAERAAKAIPFEPWINVRRDLEVACTRAGVGEPTKRNPKRRKVTPRDLRRSHAMALRAQGVEPHLIGKMLGHADSRMVERVYGRLPRESLAIALRWRVEGRQEAAGRPQHGRESTAPAEAVTTRENATNACTASVAASCVPGAPTAPERRPDAPLLSGNLVSGDGIEPPTRGFSILCSTD